MLCVVGYGFVLSDGCCGFCVVDYVLDVVGYMLSGGCCGFWVLWVM